MDEGVCTVGPVEQKWVLEEPGLHVEFEEDVKTLFEVDELQRMATGYVYGAFYHCYGGECATELVYLIS